MFAQLGHNYTHDIDHIIKSTRRPIRMWQHRRFVLHSLVINSLWMAASSSCDSVF